MPPVFPVPTFHCHSKWNNMFPMAEKKSALIFETFHAILSIPAVAA